jgi:DNA polymerase (family 10)
MPGRSESLAGLFRELAQLTVLDEGSPNAFRVRAYENAIEAISSHRGDLETLSERELTAIPGIGQSTAKKIREFFQGGTIAKLEELRRKYPADFVELARIPGLGPKTLLRLRSELGVQNAEGLKAALEGKKLREIRGFGAKMEEKLLQALDRRGSAGKDARRPIAEAMPIARELVSTLEELPDVERAQYCGSLRRLRETVADVDIVVASREPLAVREAFVKMPTVREVIGSGDTKTSVMTSTGLQVDLRIVEPRQFGAACQYFTGSKAHNIKLRQRALARKWLLNEYGLSDAQTGEVIAAESEEAIYRALDLPLIPPPMREDRGEIEHAEKGALPPPVRLEDVRGDLHVHTTLSGDGKSPLEDVVRSAAQRGYEYLAITDHAENLAMSGVSRDQLVDQRSQIDALAGRYPGMSLLHGSE